MDAQKKTLDREVKKLKKNRSMMAGIGLLAVMCIGYAGVNGAVSRQESRQAAEEEAAVIRLTNLNEVTKISITSQDGTQNFLKEEGQWKDADDPDRPLKQSLVSLLASSGADLRADRELEGAGDLKNYGLDQPLRQAVFMDSQGNEAAVLIGNELEDGRYYAKLEDEPQVYTIDSGLVSAMDYSYLEFIQPDTLPQTEEDQIQEVTVETGESCTLYSREEDTLTEEMAAAAAGLTLGQCTAWKPDQEELQAMGFDGSQIRLKYTYTSSEEAEGSGQSSSVSLEIGDLMEGESSYYVRLEGSWLINQMSKSALEVFLNPGETSSR